MRALLFPGPRKPFDPEEAHRAGWEWLMRERERKPFDPEEAWDRRIGELLREQERPPFDPEVAEQRAWDLMMERWRERQAARRRIVLALRAPGEAEMADPDPKG
jgi:hypothetical protein